MANRTSIETIGGVASESSQFAKLCEHLRLAAECAYIIGHLRKANGDDVTASGFLGIGQLLERAVKQVTTLITKRMH